MTQRQPPRGPAMFFLFVIVAWMMAVVSYVIGGALRVEGHLNTVDLYPVGPERGSFSEYALNVWTWDGIQLVMTVGAILVTIVFLLAVLRYVRRGEGVHNRERSAS